MYLILHLSLLSDCILGLLLLYDSTLSFPLLLFGILSFSFFDTVLYLIQYMNRIDLVSLGCALVGR
jgi:hypothetical protein